eukprot:COSAG01_NODE_6231_length_3778_cov_23.720304_5_plen_137_part_00
MSDPGHVPLPEAGRTWVNGDGQLGKWVHEHFAEIFQPKEEAYHHAVTARAVQGMKKVLVELEELNKRTQGEKAAGNAAQEGQAAECADNLHADIVTLLTRPVGVVGGLWHWLTKVVEESDPPMLKNERRGAVYQCQ